MTYIDIIANDKKIIGFRPEIKRVIKNTNATILLQQIMYWYSINNHQPFYKFIEPCEHEKYKAEDSWCEELAFSRKEFRTAFKVLKDLELVISKTNMSRVTFYDLNIGNLDKLLKGIYISTQRGFTKVPKGDLDYSKTMLPTETTTETTHNSDKDSSSPDSNPNTDINFIRAFTEFAIGNKFKGNKKEAYSSYKNIDIDKNLLLLSIYRFLRDSDIERKVGFKKFIDDGVYLSYLPRLLEITKDSVIYSGEYNLDTFEFSAFDGRSLGHIEPKELLDIWKQKDIKFLNLDKKAS